MRTKSQRIEDFCAILAGILISAMVLCASTVIVTITYTYVRGII